MRALLQSAVEIIQLFPPGAFAKNGSDVKRRLDAIEDISRSSHVGTVIIVGSDSLIPVAQKIKVAGRTLIGIGSRRKTNKHTRPRPRPMAGSLPRAHPPSIRDGCAEGPAAPHVVAGDRGLAANAGLEAVAVCCASCGSSVAA
jgi:hypothetical protein